MKSGNSQNSHVRQRIAWLLGAVTLCICLGWISREALATSRADITITVDRTDDVAAAQTCADAAPMDCSLRGAISKANADTGNNYTIQLANGATYQLTLAGSAEDDNALGDLDIKVPMNILGNNAVIDGSAVGERVLDVGFIFFGVVNLQDLTLRGGLATGGFPTGSGGGIDNKASQLNLTHVTVRDNSAESGGGIANNGGLILQNSTVISNYTSFLGGGIDNGYGGMLTLLQSTVTSNTAASGGGGIYNSHNNHVTIDDNSHITYNNVNNGSGGGINNAGQMTMTNSTIRNNQAFGSSFSSGGGISNRGRMTVTEVTISHNSATYRGGGIELGTSFQPSTPSRLDMFRVTVANNTAGNDGGGIYGGGERLEVYESTLSDNMATRGGGGFYADNNFTTFVNSTISGNSADVGGGVLDGFSKSAQFIHVTITANRAITGAGMAARGFYDEEYYLLGSIIADNDGDDVVRISNLRASFSSNGYNVVGNGNATNAFNFTDDVTNTNALLSPLADNGGSTLTHALSPTSPAVDRVPNDFGISFDQRRQARPVGSLNDSGAYEGADGTPLAVGLISAETATLPIYSLLVIALLGLTVACGIVRIGNGWVVIRAKR